MATLYIREVGGTTARATLACTVTYIVVSFSSPSPGAGYIMGLARTTTGTSSLDVPLELSFRSDFSVIASPPGGITPVGGAWSGPVTAVAGDVGQPKLYVREVGGSTSRDDLDVVTTDWEACFAGATPVLIYDINRTDLVSVVAGEVISVTQVTGGTVADVLVGPSGNLAYVASDADFGGLPSARNATTKYLKSTTPASAASQAQPNYRVLLATEAAAASQMSLACADNTDRQELWSEGAITPPYWVGYAGGPLHRIYAGETGRTNIIPKEIESLAIIYCDGANSWVRVRRSDGLVAQGKVWSTIGTQQMRGVSLLAHNSGGVNVVGAVAAEADVTGLTSGNITLLDGYADAIWGTTKHYRTIVSCVGNSLTIGAPPTIVPYPTPLLALLGADDQVWNWGHSSYDTEQLTALLATEGAKQFDGISHARNVMILWESVNDHINDGCTPAQSYARHQAFVTAARAAGWTGYILVTAIGPNNAWSEVERAEFNALLVADNAGADGTVTAISTDPALDPPAYDGLHYTTAQHVLIAAHFHAAIAALAFP